MGRVTWSPLQLQARAYANFDDSWRLPGATGLRPRVPLPPFVPSHSSAALEAKAHALVERAAAFAPPAMAIHEQRFHALLAEAMGVQPF